MLALQPKAKPRDGLMRSGFAHHPHVAANWGVVSHSGKTHNHQFGLQDTQLSVRLAISMLSRLVSRPAHAGAVNPTIAPPQWRLPTESLLQSKQLKFAEANGLAGFENEST